MACERYREALADVAAGVPAPAAVEEHLGSCAGCREELAVRRRALALADEELAALLSAEPSPSLTARIRQEAARPSSAPVLRFAWLWPATAAAAAAAALLVALVVWLGRGPSPSPEARVAVHAPVVPRDSASPGREGSATRPMPRAAPRPAPEGSTGSPYPSPPRRPPAARPDVLREPEVLVPPGGGEALLRLVAIVHRERLSPAGLAAAGQPAPELTELVPLDIKPLEIVPLDPAETSGT
ncbi:MAG TPA: hypothetical protein VMT70_19165 [Vicinamibacteria bacterium]|nr:hypothetical protein [Vicinamibacteria bacterium]